MDHWLRRQSSISLICSLGKFTSGRGLEWQSIQMGGLLHHPAGSGSLCSSDRYSCSTPRGSLPGTASWFPPPIPSHSSRTCADPNVHLGIQSKVFRGTDRSVHEDPDLNCFYRVPPRTFTPGQENASHAGLAGSRRSNGQKRVRS